MSKVPRDKINNNSDGDTKLKKNVPSGQLSKKNENEKFLKISPNLFTPERSHLFDSIDLYIQLLKSNTSNDRSFIEQGERLRNISWRILNKSLLHNGDINRSKKRDGVKNIYYILNPVNKQKPIQRATDNPEVAVNSKQNIRPINTTTQTSNLRPRPVNYIDKDSNTMRKSKTPEPLEMDLTNKKQYVKPSCTSLFSSTQCHKQSASTSNNSNGTLSHNKQNEVDSNKNLKTSYSAINSNNSNNAYSVHSTLKKHESPENVVKGFDTNTLITRKSHSNIGSNENSILNLGSSHLSSSKESGNNDKGSLHQNSLFGNPSSRSKSNGNNSANPSVRNNTSKLFFSSEDDESDWNNLSEDEDDDDFDEDNDSLYDDDEEEENYYRKQWDNLLFAKTTQTKNSVDSVSNSSSINPSPQENIKRSLLSGLFLNNLPSSVSSHALNNSIKSKLTDSSLNFTGILGTNIANSMASVSITSGIIDKPVIGTSTVTAIGSINSHKSVSPEVVNTPFDPQFYSTQPSKRGSFSSIASEFTRERYIHESNAPPSAQTLLPTALSTHMFLPNNIYQQRMAASGVSSSRRGLRRESIDIPTRTRSNTYIKTRMEITEEEKLSQAYSRRNNNQPSTHDSDH